MKYRYVTKPLRPCTRSLTQNDEEDNLPSFSLLFPEERIELKLVRQLANRNYKESLLQDYRRGPLVPPPNRFSRNKILLPKIDKLQTSQVRTDLTDCKTPANNKIPDNEFLDMREFGDSPQESCSPEVDRQKNILPPFEQRINTFRQWARSESKRKNQRSPPPIILASPLIKQSNRYLKVCRAKGFSMNHRTEPCPLEMTFFPLKVCEKSPAL